MKLSSLLPGAGYTLVRAGGKAPIDDGWQNRPHTLQDAGKWAKSGGSNGLLTGYAAEGPRYYLWDFDSRAERGYESSHLSGAIYFHRPNAPDRVKIVFRCEADLPGRKSHKHGIELLGIGNHGVIHGRHESGAPILWGGDHVPVLHPDTVEALWDEWTEGDVSQKREYTEQGPPSDAAVAHSREIVKEFLAHAGIAFTRERDYDDIGRKYVLSQCPFNPADNPHANDSAAAILIFADGHIGATCHHARCQAIIEQQFSGWQYLLSKYSFTPTPRPAPLPEGATVSVTGTITLKATPTPAPTPQPELPACTLALCERLAAVINTPAGKALLTEKIQRRQKEMYVRVVRQALIEVTASIGGWAGNIDARELGRLLDKSHTSANRNMHALDEAGLVRYRHATGQAESADAPPMHLDLRPLVLLLLPLCGEDVTGVGDDCALSVTDLDPNSKICNVYEHHTCNIFTTFSGGGEYADVSMRVHHSYRGVEGRTLRSLSDAALNGLALPARGELEVTRQKLVDKLGMSKSSAAGATKVYEEVGLVTVEREGRRKVYVFAPDWQQRLKELAPHMVSFNAHYRLRINNINARLAFLARRIARLPLGAGRGELEQRCRKLKGVRSSLILQMQARTAIARETMHPNGMKRATPPKLKRRPVCGAEGRALRGVVLDAGRAERLWGVAA